MAIVVRSRTAPPDYRPRLELDPRKPGRAEPLAASGAPWIAQRGDLHQALGQLSGVPTLADSVRIQLGVKTGANHLFLAPTADFERELIRPALRGRDVRAFRANPSGRILWTHDAAGAVLESLPPVAALHFARHCEALRRRADDRGAAPWQLFRAAAGRPVPRVVWSDLAPRLEAACLVTDEEARCVPLNTCYVVLTHAPAAALAICAWLNSTWIRAAARATANPAHGGYARFTSRAVGGVPLPPGVPSDTRFADLAIRGATGESIQEELDALAADCLALGASQRRVLGEVVGVGAPRRR